MKRTRPLARSPMKKRARKPSETRRVYGGAKRVAWIKQQACIARGCFCDGDIENAHAVTGGIGRKADAKFIVPLCRYHHAELHSLGRATFEHDYQVSLDVAASVTESRWQLHCAGLTQKRRTA